MRVGSGALAAAAGVAATLGLVLFALGSGGPARREMETGALPPCAAHHGWDGLKVVEATGTSRPRWVLLGLDLSPSNEAVVRSQLDQIGGVVADLPAQVGFGTLLISDRSDHSDLPDLPLQPPIASMGTELRGLDCWPECPLGSLAARSCRDRVNSALDRERARVEAQIRAATAAQVEARAEAFTHWRGDIEAWRPTRPATSLVRFWDKVADLPPVRDDPSTVQVFVLSDLEESRTPERRALLRAAEHHARTGRCDPNSPLPRLDGLRVVLVRSVVEAVDAPLWARRWQTLLTCAGARVELRRYGSAVPLSALVDADRSPKPGGTP